MSKGIGVYLRDGGLYTISEEQINWWKELYPSLDIEYELGILKEMWATNAIPRKTAKNINKYINKHLYDLGNTDRRTYE
jgi:hypothetical protein